MHYGFLDHGGMEPLPRRRPRPPRAAPLLRAGAEVRAGESEDLGISCRLPAGAHPRAGGSGRLAGAAARRGARTAGAPTGRRGLAFLLYTNSLQAHCWLLLGFCLDLPSPWLYRLGHGPSICAASLCQQEIRPLWAALMPPALWRRLPAAEAEQRRLGPPCPLPPSHPRLCVGFNCH